MTLAAQRKSKGLRAFAQSRLSVGLGIFALLCHSYSISGISFVVLVDLPP